MSHCGFISQDALTGLAETLLLNGTNIAAIDPLVTQSLTGLDVLRLNNNALTQVPAESFANLVNLSELYLNQNEIATIGDAAFANMTNLTKLYLDSNSLSAIPANLYSNHTNLEVLSFSNNQIQDIAADAFTSLPKLASLHLNNNSISQLSAASFNALTATEIDLSFNNLASLPFNLLVNHADPSSITTFNLAGNAIATANSGNGWQISDAQWQSSGTEFTLSIDHALPADLTVPFTVVNGTVDGDTSGEVTILSGDTSSNSITLLANLDATAYSLTSDLTKFSAWSGHINAATIAEQLDETYCGLDDGLELAILSVVSVSHCAYISQSALTGLAGTLLLNGTNIAAIDPLVTQSITGLDVLRLNNNALTADSCRIFCQSWQPERALSV